MLVMLRWLLSSVPSPPPHPSSLVGSRRGLPTNSRFGMGVDGGEIETIDVKHKRENNIVRAMISSTNAKPVPTPEEDAEIVAQYEIHKARMVEQQKINKRKRVGRRVEGTSVGGIGAGLASFPSSLPCFCSILEDVNSLQCTHIVTLFSFPLPWKRAS